MHVPTERGANTGLLQIYTNIYVHLFTYVYIPIDSFCQRSEARTLRSATDRYAYIYVFTSIYTYRFMRPMDRGANTQVGLYTLLPLQIVYGVWHTQGGAGEGVVYAQ